jgi:hypothetical protein
MATHIILPPLKVFKQDTKNHSKYGYSDHYGAIKVAEKYIGKSIYFDYPNNFFLWLHGSSGHWENCHPGVITYYLNNTKLKYFVATKDQENYLKSCGYQNAMAIGLPIIYETVPEVNRIPNSLLIMPPHTLTGFNKSATELYLSYINFIKPFLSRFKTVVACIHSACLQNGMWINEFKSIGVEIISGASTEDENALLRQLYLFRQFETMTTTDFGSHVAYALYANCKVSIAGPKVIIPLSE